VADKTDRHNAIRDIVSAKLVASQEELRQQLTKRGWDVTQSTLSRDLRELRLARIPDDRGRLRYTFPDAGGGDIDVRRDTRRIDAILPQFLLSVEAVQVMIVARTVASGAQPVAEALDHAGWPDVAGTIAGDNTVLIICRSTAGRERVVRRLKEYLGAHQ